MVTLYTGLVSNSYSNRDQFRPSLSLEQSHIDQKNIQTANNLCFRSCPHKQFRTMLFRTFYSETELKRHISRVTKTTVADHRVFETSGAERDERDFIHTSFLFILLFYQTNTLNEIFRSRVSYNVE